MEEQLAVEEQSKFACLKAIRNGHISDLFGHIKSSRVMSRILPPELMELQLSQIDLLLAMYPEEAVIDSSSENVRADLVTWINGNSETPTKLPSTISVSLNLDLSGEISEPSGPVSVLLDLVIPIQHEGQEPPEDPPACWIRVKHSDSMSKAEVSSLQAGIPNEDLLSAIEHVKEACLTHIKTSKNPKVQETVEPSTEPLVRVWFYFPSISTRSKRDDLINHGPSYGLSGFLLAGKPGILCLEGGSRSIDDYMKFIKTDSWGDIPAHHKKVSERHRETGSISRVFAGMVEITDLLGERRGERANRNDMKAVEAWLDDRGLGDAFKKVLM
ncbi:hypothetical protein SUNI508_03052 [Seiridium unicorne]|uniref:Small nuclear ribonucleoprotein Prp3 C-terminal domain-containing protein n=1 Tax=Seiridium unicorne TaxID=138068 RepID=A0ABR2VFW7_9PEZI